MIKLKKKVDYIDFFKGKKITVMGLGLLGRGVGDIQFMADCGAILTVTDLKTEEQLKESLDKLKKYKNIKYTLGRHDLADFRNSDLIIKGGGVPIKSPFIAEAQKNNIPVKMSVSLFAKLSGAMIIGITGTRGKTTTTYAIYEILKRAGKPVFLAGNIKGISTLAMLKKVKDGDIFVMELDSWQLQGFGYEKISPHISVFTTLLPDHLNYYGGDMELYFKDKANIFINQRENDFLIIGENIAEKILAHSPKPRANILVTKASDVPNDWKLKVIGEHNKYNLSCAIAVARCLNIDEAKIKSAVENFKGVEGRMEYIKTYKGVKIYNDTTATTPDATISALKALGNEDNSTSHKLRGTNKNIVLIFGGSDKNLDMSKLINEIPKYCKKVIILPGSGTEKLKSWILDSGAFQAVDLKEAVKISIDNAKKGDTILFSPAFASFGQFLNEYDRGDKFNNIIKKLR